MARDTADTTLVKGAAMAAGAGIENYGLAAAKGMTDISKSFGDLGASLAKEVGEMEQRFDDFAEAELARPENDANTYMENQKLMEQLERRKKDWIMGGKKDREMIKWELEEEGQTISQWDEVRQNLAKNNKDLNKKFKTSALGQSIVEALQGPIKKDANGRRGYYLTGDDGKKVFKTLKQVNEIINQNTYDKVSKGVIDATIDKTISEGKNAGKDDKFNYTQELMKWENIITKGNVTSLATQEHVPGRIFYDDLQEMLVNNTYGDLGINANRVNRFDPTPESVVTPEDAKVIADNLMKNKRLTQRYLSTYFTNYAEQNWNNSNPNGNKGDKEGGTVYKDHDNSWDYKVVNGRWQAKRKAGGQWTDIHDKFPSSVVKLNKKYPNAGGGTSAGTSDRKSSGKNKDQRKKIKWSKKNNQPVNTDTGANIPRIYLENKAIQEYMNDDNLVMGKEGSELSVTSRDVRYTSNNFVERFNNKFGKYGIKARRIKHTKNTFAPDKVEISFTGLGNNFKSTFKVNFMSGTGKNTTSAEEINKFLAERFGQITKNLE